MTKLDRTVIDPERPAEPPSEATAVHKLTLGPGLRIEQYELIRELGRGGMGQVFLARDTRLGRRVAMKFLVSSSPKFTERFVVEARATARCSHENIVVIHEVDEYLGLPYMVLEYVEGASLAKLMAGKRLPPGRAVELIVPVVRALARAHAADIVHRDLKPENIVVTLAGTVKVLDFGIATLFAATDDTSRKEPVGEPGRQGIAGTLPYMSPEQLGMDDVDARSDLWAVGIILYELLAAKHPLDPVTQGRLFGAAAALGEPMPSLGDAVPGLPDRLVAVVARCLAKRKADRFATASELLAELELLLPGRAGRHLVADESPYPGLNAFQEADANRFFGRSADIASMALRLREQPLVGVVGPSGVGKSSFVRAGVVPALKASGEAWEVLIVRPGRQPIAALASALDQLRDTKDSDPALGRDAIDTLRAEPGVFGARLRARARRKRSQILLFVDQHEELYTLVHDAAERLAFTACLVGAADDAAGPLRVVVAMRSDFLDRAAEDRHFVQELLGGLVFLQPPSRAGLEEALVQPLELLGFSFETGIVASMLDTLGATPGPLPLLQFTAAKLWENRDKARRMLTSESYTAMGGVAGALATHADEVLDRFTAADQKLVRAIFQRLVTPERTRAIVDTTELRDIASPKSGDIERILGLLVAARLVVVHARGDGEGEGAPAVELAHESLVKSWPTLQRWLDENQEDAAFIAQLRAAAKQWEQKNRAQGLLWRNEAMEEARLWRTRYQRELPGREQAFLDAVLGLAERAARRRRRIIVSAFAFLLALVAAAGVALFQIRAAEHTAENEAQALAHSLDALRDKEAARQLEEQRRHAAETAEQQAEAKQAQATLAEKSAEQQAADEKAAKQQLVVKAAEETHQRQLAEQRARDEAAKTAALAAEKAKKIEEQKKRNGQITNVLK